MSWFWPRKRNSRKEDGKPLTSEEIAQLDTPLPVSAVVQAVQMIVAQTERRDEAIRKEMRARGFRRWMFIFLLFFIAILLVVNILGGVGGTPPVRQASEPLSTIPLAGKKGTAHVAFIVLDSDIGGNKYSSPPGVENTEWYVKSTLDLAKKHENLSAVVLNITSYGGDAVTSAHCSDIIKKFRTQYNIPVIAFVSNNAYSGGYYCALGAGQIVLDPDATIGSVGVIMKWFSTATIGKVFGVGDVTIATGPLKSCIGQWTELTPECRAGFARTVDYSFKRFLARMSESRGIPLQQLIDESKSPTGTTNGGIFSPPDALERHMIDAIQNEDELFASIAKDIATKNPNFKEVEFVQYDMQLGPLRELVNSTSQFIGGATEFMSTLSDVIHTRAQMRAQ